MQTKDVVKHLIVHGEGCAGVLVNINPATVAGNRVPLPETSYSGVVAGYNNNLGLRGTGVAAGPGLRAGTAIDTINQGRNVRGNAKMVAALSIVDQCVGDDCPRVADFVRNPFEQISGGRIIGICIVDS